ncbi:DedA family protein [Numidum massiliense]|uniref:DedA family protein n=1 Tax=Numidum massiliense TaxID=1522315 RepID=UPI0006D57907|nr:DedA family protein [Numidum massiliense]
MDTSVFIHWITEYGYIALFISLWLGIVGMPIPDEVIVMSAGAVSAMRLLQPVPSFLVTYLGVISGLTIGYLIGRVAGTLLLDKLLRKKKWQKYVDKSRHLLDKYGPFALCISYFFPFVRHLVPYLVGMNKMSFGRYTLFSFTTGCAWTALYFVLGFLFGSHIEKIGRLVNQFGWYALYALLLIATIALAVKVYTAVKSAPKGE